MIHSKGNASSAILTPKTRHDRRYCAKRGLFVLCIAGLMLILSFISCTPPKEIIKTETVVKEVCSHRAFLRTLRTPADFDNAVKKNQEILSESPGTPPGDEALFNMGLIYAHHGNPHMDYKKSVGYFKALIKDFPRSPFIEEARMWIGVLEDIQKAMKVDIEIEEKKRELSK